jgi:hypothetical protein
VMSLLTNGTRMASQSLRLAFPVFHPAPSHASPAASTPFAKSGLSIGVSFFATGMSKKKSLQASPSPLDSLATNSCKFVIFASVFAGL